MKIKIISLCFTTTKNEKQRKFREKNDRFVDSGFVKTCDEEADFKTD